MWLQRSLQIKPKQAGFTLVELSMVLLIIGIMLSGVLVTNGLIENTRVKRTINDLEGFKIAYYSYYSRTADYPGNGTGNTQSPYILLDAVNDLNDGNFFEELFTQGFITNPTPPAALVSPGYYFVNYLPSDGTAANDSGTILGKNQACITALESKHAQQLDIHMDDGVWNTGVVRTNSSFLTSPTHTLCLEI